MTIHKITQSNYIALLGDGRNGVPVYSDATYQKAHKSTDTELNKVHCNKN